MHEVVRLLTGYVLDGREIQIENAVARHMPLAEKQLIKAKRRMTQQVSRSIVWLIIEEVFLCCRVSCHVSTTLCIADLLTVWYLFCSIRNSKWRLV